MSICSCFFSIFSVSTPETPSSPEPTTAMREGRRGSRWKLPLLADPISIDMTAVQTRTREHQCVAE